MRWQLAELVGRPTAECEAALWRLAWRGLVRHEAMRPLRRAILADFRHDERPAPATPPAGRRTAFRRWQATRTLAGRWSALDLADPAADDPLRAEERNRERVRLLADRYGILARELLAAELPAFGWSRLARTMRALELAGELVGGHFVAGLPGLQFATPEFLRRAASGPPDGALWWHAATDPASLCGLDLPALAAGLPRRQAGNGVVWRGDRIALVVRRGGRELDFRVAPGDAGLGALLAPLVAWTTREFDPVRSIDVETVNGEPAASSPYREAFARFAVSRTSRGVRLRRRLDAAG